jgi:hypothetical protein
MLSFPSGASDFDWSPFACPSLVSGCHDDICGVLKTSFADRSSARLSEKKETKQKKKHFI